MLLSYGDLTFCFKWWPSAILHF